MELLWDVVEREMHIIDVQSTTLQQLCGDMVNESVPKSGLKAKGVQASTKKVYLMKCLMMVYRLGLITVNVQHNYHDSL